MLTEKSVPYRLSEGLDVPLRSTLHGASAYAPRCIAFSSTLTFSFHLAVFFFILCLV